MRECDSICEVFINYMYGCLTEIKTRQRQYKLYIVYWDNDIIPCMYVCMYDTGNDRETNSIR